MRKIKTGNKIMTVISIAMITYDVYKTVKPLIKPIRQKMLNKKLSKTKHKYVSVQRKD